METANAFTMNTHQQQQQQPPTAAARYDVEDAQPAAPLQATTNGLCRPDEEDEDVKTPRDNHELGDTDDVTHRAAADDDVVFLLLGDGDFTFSLDLATWVRETETALSSYHGNTTTSSSTKHYHLICTSFDTLNELRGKYKDTDSILHRLQSQQQQHQYVCKGNSKRLSITVRHGVNAIVNQYSTDDFSQPTDPSADVPAFNQHQGNDNIDEESSLRQKADHVCFHHPHLGTENATLHQKFLAHLFHSIDRYWMREEGTLSTRRAPVFHLTLVDGQFERWKAEEAARRHGFILLEKTVFVPPPVAKSTYCYRRHQTGKSFGSRRRQSTNRVEAGGSTTYSFGRMSEKGRYIASGLPWQTASSSSNTTNSSVGSSIKQQKPQQQVLPCPFCDKEFVEKRSLNSHVRDKHPAIHSQTASQKTTKRIKREKDSVDMDQLGVSRYSSSTIAQGTNSLRCSLCQKEGLEREFSSQQGMDDHIRAKHSGIHTYIAPDWSQASRQHQNKVEQQQQHHGSPDNGPTVTEQPNGEPGRPADILSSYPVGVECIICGSQLAPGTALEDHLKDFLPIEGGSTFACRWCTKTFREERAVKQHENFCSFSTSR